MSPFKVAFIERMARYFSEDIIYEVIVPSYPQIRRRRTLAFRDALSIKFLGDQEVVRSATRFQPNLIYTDNTLYASQAKLGALLKRLRFPFIIHLRGDWWREYSAWFALASTRERFWSIQQYMYNWSALTSAREITPICQWLARQVHHHLPWKRLEVVYQGVEPSYFYPDPAIETRHPAVAIIQNHTIYPKVVGLLNFRKVIEKMAETHFYITTGEPIEQSYFPMVKESLGTLPNVHFITGISHPNGVRQLLSSSDLYVIASGLDCCPTTVLEASLMERPVVGSHVGGIPELVVQGKTGWTVRNDDVEGWLKKIRELLNDRKMRLAMGRAGKEWVSRNFSWPIIARQVERILRENSS